MTRPAYIRLVEDGVLEKRVQALRDIMNECRLCPRECRVNRNKNEKGVCRTGRQSVISSYGPHFGEEDPLVGRNGSGTIFFTHCNLLCEFCQNFDISHEGQGREAEPEVLSLLMLELKRRGCHNINFVTPSHVVAQIVEALPLAVKGGLDIPLVYNSGGYDSVETLRLLDGVIDIYMPDFKFWDNAVGEKFCGVSDYRDKVVEAVKEMHRQVGDLELNEDGVAVKGLLVRHLVMPNGLAGTEAVSRFLADEISDNTYINVMGQYRPCGRAFSYPEINRAPSVEELKEATDIARKNGLKRLDERRRFRFLRI